METTNHECYVSLEVSKLLKEAGFNWECRCYYETSGKFRGKNSGSFINHNSPLIWQNNGNTDTQLYSAPTLDVAQRWLREVKGIEFDLCWHLTLDNQYKYAYAIKIKSIWKGLDKGKEIKVPSMDCLEAETCLNTFEEAQEAGIKKALEIILGKGE